MFKRTMHLQFAKVLRQQEPPEKTHSKWRVSDLISLKSALSFVFNDILT